MQLGRILQVTIPLSFVALCIQAVAQTARDKESEVSRFLASSGMAQIVLFVHNMSVLHAMKQGQLSKARADCYISRGAASYVAEVLSPLVRRHYSKVEDLAAINDFNDSEVGRRIVTHIQITQKAALDKFLRGQSPDPLTPLQFTSSELAEIARWEATSAFASYRNFEGVLKDMRSSSEYKAWLATARTACSNVQ